MDEKDTWKPDMVNICGTPYRIKYCERPSDVDVLKRDSKWGEIDFWTSTIRIYSESAPEERIEILLHEILHALFYTLGLGNLLKNDNRDGEETFIHRFTPHLRDTLLRNGWLKDPSGKA